MANSVNEKGSSVDLSFVYAKQQQRLTREEAVCHNLFSGLVPSTTALRDFQIRHCNERRCIQFEATEMPLSGVVSLLRCAANEESQHKVAACWEKVFLLFATQSSRR